MNQAVKIQTFDCPGCGKSFTSSMGFERHRMGKWGRDRRCATPDELEDRGMRLVTLRGDPGRRAWVFARNVRPESGEGERDEREGQQQAGD